WALLWAQLSFGAQSIFDPQQNSWTIHNESVYAIFALTSEGHFVTNEVSDLHSGDRWTASPNQPSALIRLQAGGEVFDAQRQYTLRDQSVVGISPSGIRQNIVLDDLSGAARFTIVLEVFDGQPVLHYSVIYRNLTASTVVVSSFNLLPWTFDT